MKKKLSLLMAIIMVVTTVMTALPAMTFTVTAASNPFSVAADQAANGTAGTYATFLDAVKAVKDGGTIKMTADFKGSDRTDQDSVAKTKSWTLDGDGHKWSIDSNTWALRVGASGKTLTINNVIFDYAGSVAADRLVQTSNVSTSCNVIFGQGTKFTKTGTGTLARGIMNQPCSITIDGAVFELNCPAISTWGAGVYNIVLKSGTLGNSASGAINNGYETDNAGSTVTGNGNMQVYIASGITRPMTFEDIKLTNATVVLPNSGINNTVTVYETTTSVVEGETVYGIGNVYVNGSTKVENGTYAAAVELAKKATKDVTIKLNGDVYTNKQLESATDFAYDIIVDGSDGNGGRYTLSNVAGNTFRMNGIGAIILKDIEIFNNSNSGSFIQARSKYMTIKVLNSVVYSRPGNHVINVLADDLATSATVQGLVDAYNDANETTYSAVMNIEIKDSTIINARGDNAVISFERNKNNHFFKADIDNSTLIGGNIAIKIVDGANVDIDINDSTLISSKSYAIDAAGAAVKGNVNVTGTSRLVGKSGALNNIDTDYTVTGTYSTALPLSMNVGNELEFYAAFTLVTPLVSADAATGDNADFTINLTNDITVNLTYGASTIASPANAKVVVNGLKGTDGKYKIYSTGYNVILSGNDKVSRDLTFRNVEFIYGTAVTADAGNFMQWYCSGNFTLEDCTATILGDIRWSWIALNSENGSEFTFTLDGSTITGIGTDKNATGLFRADKGAGKVDIKLINSTIDASKHESRAIHSANANVVTVCMDTKSTVSSKNYPNSPISTAVTFGVLQEGGQKLTVTYGETSANYTSWNDAIVAMNAATDDVTVTLGSDVIIQYAGSDFSNGGREILNVNGKKITVDGQNKYGIIAVNATNTLRMGGNFEFKNMTISDNVKGSLFDMRKQSNLTLTNVDFYGAANHEYTTICTLYESNIVTDVILNNVTAQGYGNYNDSTTSFIRTGNPGQKNFVNIKMTDCDIDMGSARNADGIIVTNATTANVTVINSKITSAGNGKAINVGTANPNAPIEGFGAATVITSVKSDIGSVTSGSAVEEFAPEMNKGASVRISTGDAAENGIRFTSVFTRDVLDAIAVAADDTNFKFGTLITVTEAVVANGGEFDEDAIRALGWTVADVAVNEGITVDEETGDTTIRAALINLKNNTRKYSAIAYVEFTVGGQVCRVYSDYNETDNSRSMAEIAELALDDTATKRGGKYIYKCEDGTYSPYTTAQRAVLEGYTN